MSSDMDPVVPSREHNFYAQYYSHKLLVISKKPIEAIVGSIQLYCDINSHRKMAAAFARILSRKEGVALANMIIYCVVMGANPGIMLCCHDIMPIVVVILTD